MTGKIIALEGIDGSGKSSVWESLKKDFDTEYPGQFLFTQEPAKTGYRDLIKQEINKGDEILCALLFAADHRKHIEQVIKPAINKGVHVITDRYYHSHLVYQSVMLENYFDWPEPWLRNIYSNNWTLPPDYVVYLHVTPEVAEQRIKRSRGGKIDAYERKETLGKFSRAYWRILQYEDRCTVIPFKTDDKDISTICADVHHSIIGRVLF